MMMPFRLQAKNSLRRFAPSAVFHVNVVYRINLTMKPGFDDDHVHVVPKLSGCKYTYRLH